MKYIIINTQRHKNSLKKQLNAIYGMQNKGGKNNENKHNIRIK